MLEHAGRERENGHEGGDDRCSDQGWDVVDTILVVDSDDVMMTKMIGMDPGSWKGDHEACPSTSFDVPLPLSSPFHDVHPNSFPCPLPSWHLSSAFPQTLVPLSDR